MQAVQQHIIAATAEVRQQLADTRQAITELQEREMCAPVLPLTP